MQRRRLRYIQDFAPPAEHRFNLINADDNKKVGEWACLRKTDREENPAKWSVAVVWRLRAMAKTLRPRTSIVGNEQIQNSGLVKYI